MSDKSSNKKSSKYTPKTPSKSTSKTPNKSKSPKKTPSKSKSPKKTPSKYKSPKKPTKKKVKPSSEELRKYITEKSLETNISYRDIYDEISKEQDLSDLYPEPKTPTFNKNREEAINHLNSFTSVVTGIRPNEIIKGVRNVSKDAVLVYKGNNIVPLKKQELDISRHETDIFNKFLKKLPVNRHRNILKKRQQRK